jgi:hypothetical protein
MFDPVTYLFVECVAWARRRLSNPTRRWPPCSVSELTFELAAHRLCGVPIGASLAEARVFGPADRLVGVPPEYGLLYYKLGLEVDRFEGRIVNFRIVMDPASRALYWERRCTPARLLLRMLDGSRHVLSRETSEASLLELFGRPLETGPVGGDRVHSFRVDGNFIDSYHATDSGRLVELTLCLAAD